VAAFIASAASRLLLQNNSLSDCGKSDNEFLQTCLLAWSAKFGDVPETLPTKQLSKTGLMCFKISH